MPNVLIRNVPDELHAALQRRADAAGQSLQQFLLAELARLATAPSIDDVIARIARHRGGRVGFAAAVRDLSEERRAG
jgi:plasmid stability protein